MTHVEKLCSCLLDVSKCQERPELVFEYSDQLKHLQEEVKSINKGSPDGSKMVVQALTAAAAHVGSHYWTNDDNRQLAQGVLSCLATACECRGGEGVLVGGDSSDRGVMRDVVSHLKPYLTRDQWKSHPAHKQSLVWCVRRVTHPHLSPHLDSLLPLTLLFLDDHEDYHKDPTELRWYGRAEVLYEAVKPLLYWSCPDIIHALHPCLLVLLPVVDPQPRASPAKPRRSTEVFDKLLTSIQLESKIVSRKAHLSYVSNYIEMLGVYSARHLKTLIPALLSCLEHPDYCGEYTRRYALSALGTLIKHAWPRIPHHKEMILKALLRLVADLCPSVNDVSSTQEVEGQLQLVAWCLRLLGEACPDLKATYSSLSSSPFHNGLKQCLQQALAT